MKIVMLLALVGLASCHNSFFRGNHDNDNIDIEYSYGDDNDRDSGYSSYQSRPTFKRVVSPVAPLPVHYVKRVEVENPRPLFTQVVQRPIQRPQVVQVPVPAVSVPFATEYSRREPAVRTVFVQPQAVPAPRPKVVTQYVQAQPAVTHTSFSAHRQSAPVHYRPSFRASSSSSNDDDDSSEE